MRWILSSPHSGDNRQLLALSTALGGGFVTKRLAFRHIEPLLRILGGARLAGVTAHHQSQLSGPAPNLIIMAGRANEAVALWVKRHINPNVKLVYVGTPWNRLSLFDLVIATPQYQVPMQSNVLHINLPLHDIDKQKLAEAKLAFADEFANLPKPLTAVFVGGPSGPYGFSIKAGKRLAEMASSHAKKASGSLVVSTSARTPLAVADAIFSAISVPLHTHRFETTSTHNPYFAYLAMASDIIVTADSMSMISEAVATKKPVALFDIEDSLQAMRSPLHWRGKSFNQTLFRLLMKFAPARWSRDLRIVHEMTTKAGLTHWLGDPYLPRTQHLETELQVAVDRINALVHKT